MPEAQAEALSGSSKSKTQSDLQSVNLKGVRFSQMASPGGENGENRWWKPVEGRRPHA